MILLLNIAIYSAKAIYLSIYLSIYLIRQWRADQLAGEAKGLDLRD